MGIFLLMGNAGFISSTVCLPLWENEGLPPCEASLELCIRSWCALLVYKGSWLRVLG